MFPLVMVALTLWMNDLPWSQAPGFKARLAQYTSHNIAETKIDSGYSELETRQYALSEDKLKNSIKNTIDVLGWEIVSEFEQEQVLKAVVTTPLFRFKDDVLITLEKKNESIFVFVRSSSRVGKGDLGTNTRHVLNFYEMLETHIEQTSS